VSAIPATSARKPNPRTRRKLHRIVLALDCQSLGRDV
jgi:hypothetical protein